jgi:hypothetical protein
MPLSPPVRKLFLMLSRLLRFLYEICLHGTCLTIVLSWDLLNKGFEPLIPSSKPFDQYSASYY